MIWITFNMQINSHTVCSVKLYLLKAQWCFEMQSHGLLANAIHTVVNINSPDFIAIIPVFVKKLTPGSKRWNDQQTQRSYLQYMRIYYNNEVCTFSTMKNIFNIKIVVWMTILLPLVWSSRSTLILKIKQEPTENQPCILVWRFISLAAVLCVP